MHELNVLLEIYVANENKSKGFPNMHADFVLDYEMMHDWLLT